MEDDSAYGRVTDAERYRSLHAVAAELVEDLRQRFDVVVEDVPPEGRDLRGGLLSAVRVSPRGPGAAITITLSGLPGLLVRFGAEHSEPFPRCGCDACDEQPGDLADELRDKVDAVTRGRFSEPPGGYAFELESGSASGGRVHRGLRRGRTRRYEPWPLLDVP